MGCPPTAALSKTIEFSVNIKDGVNAPLDADSLPTYVIYENSIDDAFLSGTIGTLDDDNTTGAYREKIAITSTLGYELWKSYHILITSVVLGITLEKIYTFQVRPLSVEAPAAEEDPDTLAESILANAQGPQSATADGQSATQHPLRDQIEADKYLKNAGARTNPLAALTQTKIVSPGAS